MNITDTLTLVAAIAGVVLAIIGFLLRLVWSSLIAKLNGIEVELKAHVQADSAAHERIRGVEVLCQTTKEKLTDVDGRRHRYQTFNDEANRERERHIEHELRETHKWVTEKVIEVLRP